MPFAWPLQLVYGFCCCAQQLHLLCMAFVVCFGLWLQCLCMPFAAPFHALWNLCPVVAPPLQGLCHYIARDAHRFAIG